MSADDESGPADEAVEKAARAARNEAKNERMAVLWVVGQLRERAARRAKLARFGSGSPEHVSMIAVTARAYERAARLLEEAVAT